MKKKTYREDLNRHIPQKINEFASLHLPEGTPSYYYLPHSTLKKGLQVSEAFEVDQAYMTV